MEKIDPGDLDAIIVASARRLMEMPLAQRSKAFVRLIQSRESWLTTQIVTKLLAEPGKTLQSIYLSSSPPTTS